jgi:radical SAM protein with 4Fe4S-binding SPASM domain
MSKETEILLSLNRSLNNPFMKLILKYLAKNNRIEDSLRYLTGIEENPGFSCRMNSFLVATALKYGARAFDRDNIDFLTHFKDPAIRRGLINVLKGIADFGITRPQKLYAPFLVVWDFTSTCNLHCLHCYRSAGTPAPDELTREERYDVVDQLTQAGVVAIAFSGGEPIMSPDFFDIAHYAHEQGMYVSVATNGTLITEEIVKKLKDIGVSYIEISLDSIHPDIHDHFRGSQGAWQRTIRGIKTSVTAGIYTCIATTVTQYNIQDVPQIIELANQLGVDRFIHFNFIPARRGKAIMKKDISPREREMLLHFLYGKLEEHERMQVFSTAPQFARVSIEQIDSGEGEKVTPTHFAGVSLRGKAAVLADFIGGCGAGRIYCSIEPNGDIQPCVFMPVTVGNIREGFLHVWQNSEIMNDLRSRDELKGECADCPFRYVCGGCRARAYAYFNDVMGPDPGCIQNEYYWNALKQIESEVDLDDGEKKEEPLLTLIPR